MTGPWLSRASLATSLAIARSGAGGPEIGRRAAQRLARHELGEASIVQQILRRISRLLGSAGGVVPRGVFGLIVLAAVVVLVIIVVLFWVRPARARRAKTESVLTGETKTAWDYRQAAHRLAAAGDYGGAIVEGVRAIAAELDERGILPPRPGRTADELAVEAGRELSGLAADLAAVTRLFDDVRYGEKAGRQAGYELVSRVDEEVRAARVTAAAAPPAFAGLEVPR